jgi:uncharacterized SAM-binding protein YcdF (DUF218 family)
VTSGPRPSASRERQRSRSRPLGWVAAAAALVGIVLAGTFVRGFVSPTVDEAAAAGPVVVLGGSTARVERGFELADATPGRELVLSASARFAGEIGRSCDEDAVRCVEPDPLTTWGEAQLIAELARDERWPAATVVTDPFHLPRSRLLFERCLDVPVAMVATAPRGETRVPVGVALREAAASAVSWVIYRGC